MMLVSYIIPGSGIYGHQVIEHDGIFETGDVKSILEKLSEKTGFPWNTQVILNVVKYEEKPAEVRMSAESLIELQRVAAARAVLAFAEKAGLVELMSHARAFADDIQRGEIKSW